MDSSQTERATMTYEPHHVIPAADLRQEHVCRFCGRLTSTEPDFYWMGQNWLEAHDSATCVEEDRS